MDASNGPITRDLEGFLLSVRKLEESLGAEKKRNQTIAREYLTTRSALETAVRDLQNRLIQRENQMQSAAAELAQYRAAWSEVLTREAEARTALIDQQKLKTTMARHEALIQTLEAKLAESERKAAIHSQQANTYQRELQSAIARIRAAETKTAQAQKDLAAANQAKRNADEAIARAEAAMNERLRAGIAAETDRVRAELEIRVAAEKDRLRESARVQMRAEIDRQVATERRAREAAESESERLRNQLAEIETKRNQDIERARSRLLALTEENFGMKEDTESAIERANRAEKAMSDLRTEIAMHQMETHGANARMETFKKESSKAMLVERLRHDEEVRDLRRKLEQLVEGGLYAEKTDGAPAGEKIYSAVPAGIARSSRDANVADQAANSQSASL